MPPKPEISLNYDPKPSIPLADRNEIERSRAEGVVVEIEPGVVSSWEDFLATTAARTIAIDGRVEGPIERDLHKVVVNLNHHERVDRNSTLATCEQALRELRIGLFEKLLVDHNPTAKVLANDCDEDVCTTVFILRHPAFARKIENPALNRLVEMEGVMDSTGGFYPWPEEYEVLPEFFWVFEPYHRFRAEGGLTRKNPEEFMAVIDSVEARIIDHLCGQGGTIELDTRYETLAITGMVSLVRETGRHAKVGMLSDGMQAYVSVRDLPNGRYRYAIGRLSPYIDFDLPGLFAHLNQLEQCPSHDCWGGGDTIGGSPRSSESSIPPDQLMEIVKGFIPHEGQ